MIQKRDDLITIPAFAKMYGLDICAVRLMIARHAINALEMGDGKIYIDLNWVLPRLRTQVCYRHKMSVKLPGDARIITREETNLSSEIYEKV